MYGIPAAKVPVVSSESPSSNSEISSPMEISRSTSAVTVSRSLGVLGVRPLSDEEYRSIEFFATNAGPACALGDRELAKLWSHNGAALALQSDLVFHAAMALSRRRMNLLGMRNDNVSDFYFLRTLELCRESMGEEELCRGIFGSTTPVEPPHDMWDSDLGENLQDQKMAITRHKNFRPLELGVATFFIFAFSVMDPAAAKIIGSPGEVDLFSLGTGHSMILTTYEKEISETFLAPLVGPRNDLQGLKFIEPEFIRLLFEKLFELRQMNEVDQEEGDIYQETIEMIQILCTIAVVRQVRWPMMIVLIIHNPKFSEYCRMARPFARVILAHICGLVRAVVFQGADGWRNWRQEILECYKYVPDSMHHLIDYALVISDGGVINVNPDLIPPPGPDYEISLAMKDFQLY
jgi:hypothetical protein